MIVGNLNLMLNKCVFRKRPNGKRQQFRAEPIGRSDDALEAKVSSLTI